MPNHRIPPALFADLATVAGGRNVELERRCVLFRAGERAHDLYIVTSGLLNRERTRQGQRCMVQIAGPESFIGEEVLTGEPMYLSTARAVTPSRVVAIPAEAFLQLCDTQPCHWRFIAERLIEQRTALDQRLQSLCFLPIRDRILEALEELAGRMNASCNENAVIPLSQGEFAAYIGATRETTSTVLNQLSREGILELQHRSIRVIRPTATALARPAVAV